MNIQEDSRKKSEALLYGHMREFLEGNQEVQENENYSCELKEKSTCSLQVPKPQFWMSQTEITN